ncbi:MAG TPA: citrate/2-methylcitrate synthase, partial [Chitinophagales bacterium]|nr:citrate/2-methylcitrate synthase [Chitinophagales bacterium]
LRYRGYDIADLAENSNFVEVAYSLLYGELPTAAQLADFNQKLKDNSDVPAEVAAILKAMPKGTHPMAQLSAVTIALSGVYKDGAKLTEENYINMLAKFPVLVAMVIRNSQGLDFVANDKNLDYVANFLQMAFGKPASNVLVDAMDKLLILHADHEQNCSTSTVRMVGSSNANIYASITGGISALWGPLHGGANQAVLEQLEAIEKDGGDTAKFVAMAKDKNSGFRLMGFGHRVYKNFDPRAKIIKKSCDEVLKDLGVVDKKLTIAMELEQAALNDDYFVSRKLYPNVDFYSGIIYQAIGFPTDTFTTLFALGRLPGWVSQWKEMKENKEPIGRPRQIYLGAPLRSYVAVSER